MSAGRCAGCGRVDSCRKVSEHIVACGRYADLFATSPQLCLDPAAEFARHRAVTDTEHARAARRDARLRTRFAELDHRQTVSKTRWRTPPDILDDEEGDVEHSTA
jgi:hypothetical protein